MTTLNLATVIGPNLLHKQKNPDKEFAVQSFAHSEDSTDIISVVQKMINTYDTLFTVSHPSCKPKRHLQLKTGFNQTILKVFLGNKTCLTLNRVVQLPPNKMLKLAL